MALWYWSLRQGTPGENSKLVGKVEGWQIQFDYIEMRHLSDIQQELPGTQVSL